MLLTLLFVAGAGATGCVQQAPPELLEAVRALDRELAEARSAEFAPAEYAQFTQHWMALQNRLRFEEDLIRWPWEPNSLALELRQLEQEGHRVAQATTHRKDARRETARVGLAQTEQRLRLFVAKVDEAGGRGLLGQQPVRTELLIRQARSFIDQGQFVRSVEASQEAARLLDHQTVRLQAELGRYADAARVAGWRKLASRAIAWSRINHAAAIVIDKADRRLTLYQNGRAIRSYPVRLGYNGILEKRYQGDGATPEGRYRITRKRDHGQTRFYRALLLDYPNDEDRRRFEQAQARRSIPAGASIGGQIEIHGSDNAELSATLGCIMLENEHMDELFAAIAAGAPVVIVGALETANTVSLALADLLTSRAPVSAQRTSGPSARGDQPGEAEEG